MNDNFIESFLTIIPLIGIEEITVALVAMTPIVGIRGAIPLAIFVYEMSIPSALFWSILGEFFPVFFILLFLKSISEWLSKKFLVFKRFFDFLFSKTRRDYDKRLEKYGLFALFLYTGIPFPFTGAWTASLVTFLFGIPRKKAMIAIFFGVILSGINIILIIKTGIAIEEYGGYMKVVGLVVFLSLFYFLYYRKKTNKNV